MASGSGQATQSCRRERHSDLLCGALSPTSASSTSSTRVALSRSRDAGRQFQSLSSRRRTFVCSRRTCAYASSSAEVRPWTCRLHTRRAGVAWRQVVACARNCQKGRLAASAATIGRAEWRMSRRSRMRPTLSIVQHLAEQYRWSRFLHVMADSCVRTHVATTCADPAAGLAEEPEEIAQVKFWPKMA